MTDNNIIEFWQDEINRADFVDENYISGIGKCVVQATLDLIKRLQVESENLKDILYDAEGVNLVNYWHQQCKISENGCRNFSEENKNLKAEIERLQNILICFMDALGKVRKLDDIDEISLIPLMSELNKQYRIELKAEAYKECLRKIEQRDVSESDFYIMIKKTEFDNFLKELAGDNDG